MSPLSQPFDRTLRIAFLVTHPIQYQAPLLRRINGEPDMDLTAFFATDFSARPFAAEEFGRTIEWDVPLLEGYTHEVLPSAGGRNERDVNSWRPLNYGLAARLSAGRFDALWVHGYARPFHWSAMASAKRRGIKVLVRDEATHVSASRGPLKRFAKRGFFRGLERLVDAFLAIGTLNRQYYLDHGVASARIFDVPYAVDNERFEADATRAGDGREQLRAALGLEVGRPVLLFAAKLIERKQPGLLLEALSRVATDASLRRPYVVFVGDGPLRPVLETEASRLANGAVRFAGFQGQTDLPRYYDLCDALVLPSEYEPWGLVVNEAMCAARAVIASDRVGAAADLIKPGENGAIFRAGEADDLARAIRTVAEDPLRLAAMGERSLEIIRNWSFDEDLCGLREALGAVRAGEVRRR